MVKDLGVQYGGPWFDCWSVTFFPTFFMHLFPTLTVLLEYFDPVIYSCLVLPCNSVAVNVISFKPQKAWAMMVNLYAY